MAQDGRERIQGNVDVDGVAPMLDLILPARGRDVQGILDDPAEGQGSQR